MKNKKFLFVMIITIIIILILLIVPFLSQSSSSKITPKAIINNKSINLELARTLQEQEKGLMYREYLNNDSAMLFIFQDEQIRYFWMKNTLILLDIIFIDSNKNIIDIQGAEPCKSDPCKNYISQFPAKYVLELNAGYIQMNNISIGDKIELRI